MNFTELYQRIRSINERVTIPPEAPDNTEEPADKPPAPTTPVINLTDGNNGTMNLPDGSSVPVTLYPQGGMQPRMPPGSKQVIADLNGQQVTVWIYGGRGYVKNYVAASMNENSNENFMSLYKQIRAIDEGTAPEPTAPGGVIKTKNADGSVSYKPKVPGERLSSTFPANQAAKTTDAADKAKAVNEECGDMPMGMMGMSSHQGQQDSVTMNISMNGSGAGGIRDLMSILRNIESSDNTDVHSHDVGQMFGGDDIEVAFDEEMDGGFGSATTQPNTATAGIDAVTATGNDLASKGIEAPKVNGGGNPMHETVKYRLYTLYNEIKEAKEAKEQEFDALKHVKNPTKGEKEAAKDVKRGSYADRAAMLKSAETDGRLKEAGDKKTMSRAAKGYEKYGKEGMQALAKAGKEGKNLDKVRDKYNKYD